MRDRICQAVRLSDLVIIGQLSKKRARVMSHAYYVDIIPRKDTHIYNSLHHPGV